MHKASVSATVYWFLQLAGWGSILSLNLIVSGRMYRLGIESYVHSLLYLFLGICISHLMRSVIRRKRLIEGDTRRFVLGVVSTTCGFILLHNCVEFSIMRLTGLRVGSEAMLDPRTLFLRRLYVTSFLYFGWSAIYTVVLLLRKAHALQLDNIHQMEKQRELELRRIKSNINPHFIFNALNGIRALIDEDPDRARQAVTSLGNILQGSLHSDQTDIVPLRRELDIVRDYLSLQRIRFEERLEVEYSIDPDTLDLPVPFMMLQNLVENAVKHGVGVCIDGGRVRISSSRTEELFELTVHNTGRLEGGRKESGFGWHSTATRLSLIYGKGAVFTIRQAAPETVEAQVEMPVSASGPNARDRKEVRKPTRHVIER